ncbi:hypothetical protein WDU94_005539, partial [Cyamophila willieti]
MSSESLNPEQVLRMLEEDDISDDDNVEIQSEDDDSNEDPDYVPENLNVVEEQMTECIRDIESAHSTPSQISKRRKTNKIHFQRIIHRDIKPSNLLLGHDNHVQIADLGVCTEFEGPDAVLNGPAGTPAFTAPEAIMQNAQGKQFSGKAYDIWSLGITLFAFVFGRLPFDAESIPELHELIRTKEIEFPSHSSVSDGLKSLILQMLEKNPNQRITLKQIK